jgi:hypothetical protein
MPVIKRIETSAEVSFRIAALGCPYCIWAFAEVSIPDDLGAEVADWISGLILGR